MKGFYLFLFIYFLFIYFIFIYLFLFLFFIFFKFVMICNKKIFQIKHLEIALSIVKSFFVNKKKKGEKPQTICSILFIIYYVLIFIF